MRIVVDDLSGPEIAGVLQRHLDHCRAASAPENVHALDLDGLRVPEITFWSAWDDDMILGCIALKELGKSHGEIKSMHTVSEARGRGVARALLEHLLADARRRGMTRLSLETGTMDEFRAARALYEAHGFEYCPPFGDYFEDPESCCMTLRLEAA